MPSILNQKGTKHTKNAFLTTNEHLCALISHGYELAAEKLCRPLLRSENAAAALSGATRRPTRPAAVRCVRSTVLQQPMAHRRERRGRGEIYIKTHFLTSAFSVTSVFKKSDPKNPRPSAFICG
jgi:hypothetical protein